MSNKHSAFDIRDRFKCSREIMTDRRNGLLQLISSTNRLSYNLCMPESKEVLKLITMICLCYNSSWFEKIQKIWKNVCLQLLFYNRKKAICQINDCNWNGKLTQCLWKQGWLEVLISMKHSTLENTRSLQVTSWINDGTTQIYGCKWSFEITICV